ncbi:dynamin family protein [Leptodesmis sichuanensis]|uniref:dynamin family protein n=1 Tax=Leptodesmis sichuanensis TaxID=2906798 RepID=UPI001F22CC0F|nr:dynamin family protein [Leptodesmis sichuanensis]UIE36806.1 dynamin family protein [Leptodesmis sichuanensis A121]
MAYKAESFISDLDKVAKARQEFSGYLNAIANTLTQAEQEGETASGKLGLESTIEDLELVSRNLGEGVFRLLVLGDMKRGKSTFLNALIGENILPTDVNPCTAVLTVLSYGQDKQVTVHFKDDRAPERLDFETFKQRYTIPPEEAKKLQEEGIIAFPNVAYAEVQYPLTLLEKGVQIIDSPGLNDTEQRNQLTLGYINNCHAILFVLSATQPYTLGEQRYLENYIKDRGLSVFFLINHWDEIQNRLINPEDLTALHEAEDRVRQVFRTNLTAYCQVEGEDRYDDRVFEVSSLNALRQRLKNGSLEGTGFSEFIKALNHFLTKERAISELRQAKLIARQAYRTVHEACDRRIPLLSESIQELRQKIRSVQPEFDQLVTIRDQFKDEIRIVGERQASAIANSFRSSLPDLAATFEADFARYQPELKFFDFLQRGKRQEFEASLRLAFEKYLLDKIAAWSLTAQKDMDAAFVGLAKSATQYGESYTQVTDRITEKLTGQKVIPNTSLSAEDKSPGWAKWAVGLYALTTGDVGTIAMAGTGVFDWKQILLNFGGAILVTTMVYAVTGVFLGPVGMALAGLGLGSFSAEMARRKVVLTMKEELIKLLPQIAQEQSFQVYQAVKECFDTYQQEVVKRMNDDIQSRKAELDELLRQKEDYEINQQAEERRLNLLDNEVLTQLHDVEDAYDQLIGQPAIVLTAA